MVLLLSGDKAKLRIRQQIIFCSGAVICHVFTQKMLSGDVVRGAGVPKNWVMGTQSIRTAGGFFVSRIFFSLFGHKLISAKNMEIYSRSENYTV